MQEDLVSKLVDFGFTTNQAKVYLSIIQNDSITVGEIAKVSQLHRQDIYKIIPILEKKGLIIKTIDKPVLISAIPPERALNRLLAAEKEKISKKVSRLERNVKQINDEVSNHAHKEKMNDLELYFELTTDEQVKNRANITFENIKSSYDLHVNMEFIGAISKVLANRFQQLNKKINIRMVIESTDQAEVNRVIQNLNIKNRPIGIKMTEPSDTISYYIIDDCELWISLKKKTESGLPGILWTNDRNMIKFFENSFNKEWCSRKLVPLRQQDIDNVSIPQFA